jgi:dolichyl-phosphate-mannose--protein O-mannosyl transferase
MQYRFVFGALYAASLGLRLWNIEHPDSVVFDELHFVGFVHDYQQRSYFFDIHPPLAKLIYFVIAEALDAHITQVVPDSQYLNSDYLVLRVSNAVISAFCCPLIFSILINCGISLLPSCVASLVFLCETSLLPQHRLILIDGILHFFVLMHLFVLSLGRVPPFLIGLSLGFACSCKLTAWSLIPFTLVSKVRNRLSVIFWALTAFFAISFIHLWVLDKPSSDAKEFLSERLYRWLFEERTLWNIAKASVAVNCEMHVYNMKNRRFHPYQSDPITWPLLTGIWVGLWEDTAQKIEMNCMGNVFVFVPVFIALFVTGCAIRPWNWSVVSIAPIGWALSYLPFFLVPRTLFLYHYQIPLLFGFLSLGYALHITGRVGVYIGVVVVMLGLFGFAYWSPFVYAYPVADRARLIWNRNWADGGERHRNLVKAFFGVTLH